MNRVLRAWWTACVTLTLVAAGWTIATPSGTIPAGPERTLASDDSKGGFGGG